MFKKVLIAEDQDTMHLGVEDALKVFNPILEMSKYCDDALLKIRASQKDNTPFDVLITDLHFEEDHRERAITTGEDLIIAARNITPNLKIIVFSVEKSIGRIKRLYDNYHINAFVEKGRDATFHIKKALETVYNQGSYCTPNMSQLLRGANDISELEEKDILLLDMLSRGCKQKHIADSFIPPCSVSSIEKRLNKLKTLFNANSPIQLIAIAKDKGVI